MKCPACGGAPPAGARFCTDCGTRLLGPCPHCGAAVEPTQRFCGQCGGALATTVAPSGRAAEGERRQVTMMFIDLVGSTALASRLDPEEYRELIGRYQTVCAGVVHRRYGVVGKFLGDGVLAYFGFPRAHEDDAVQAVRAGLELVEALRADMAAIDVRVGIATGLVVMSEIMGDGGTPEPAAFGETPNLAARLQEVAPSGGVAICPTTHRLVAARVRCAPPEPMSLKGFSAPVRVALVEAPAEATAAARAAPMVGRGEEIDLLRRRWRAATRGEGRVVLLTGEPGIGKSRTTAALREAVAAEPHRLVRLEGSEHHTDSALFPVITHLERAARFRRDETPARRLAKLQALFAEHEPGDDGVAVLARLLRLPGDGAVEHAPQHRRALIFATLLARLERLAAAEPVLLVVEDAHWFDPTSRDLLAGIVDAAPRLRLLVVVTARPEFQPSWPQAAHVSTLRLSRLAPREGMALVARIAGAEALAPAVVEAILARTDGVPLFIEELTKAVIESGAAALATGRSASEIDIPATLQASLFARLDRLEAVRELAQIGAAVGRQFHFEVLRAVVDWPAERLADGLGRLVEAELVFRHGEIPEAVYTFKHALVRDAAYAGLLKRRRRELHRRIAHALEQTAPELVRTEPETLAHHLVQAGDAAAAAPYWLAAGRNAAERSAHLEAIAHLRRGLAAVEAMPADAARDRLELDLRYTLGPSIIATQGPASAEAVATFTATRAVCERLGQPPETLQVMFWIATASVIRGELANAEEAVAALLAIADVPDGDRPALLNALRGRSMILLFMGRLGEARTTAERFLALFDASTAADQLKARAAGQDAKASGLALLAWTLWLMHEREAASAAIAAARARAEAVEHVHTRAYVQYYEAVLHGLDGRPVAADAAAAACLALADQHGFAQWHGLARAVRGIAAAQLRPATTGQALAEVGEFLEAYRRSGYQLGITALYAMLGPALVAAGERMAAAALVADGLAIAERNGERLFQAELLRLKAHLDANATLLVQARDLARDQGARVLEQRCEIDLAAGVATPHAPDFSI